MKKKILEYLWFHMNKSYSDIPYEGMCAYNVPFLDMVDDIKDYFAEATNEVQALRNEVLNNSSTYTPNEVLDIIDTFIGIIEGKND